jgi:hypothetical protein
MSERIDAIAASRHVSANRAIGHKQRSRQRRMAFLELADRFQKSKDPAESDRLREELARMTSGN